MPAYDPRLFSPPAPVPTVIVRHQESGVKVTDVPMLLDSGDDVTLILERRRICLDCLRRPARATR